ncbi:hypothetical protein [Mycoplasma sp. P36-A1]|uniref:hypothetical protein n=1 Tax=Mycoplasma sp. P36-A1 TaxID=3252900 RepID=UPI003C2BF685
MVSTRWQYNKKKLNLFLKQKEETIKLIQQLEKALELIEYKCEYYKIAKQRNTTNLLGLKEELSMKFLNDNICTPK